MKRTFTALLALLTVIYLRAQSPDSLLGPQVWLKADRSQLRDGNWQDISVYKNNASAHTPYQLPSTEGRLNFNKAWIFDGVDDYLKIPYSAEGLAELSILTVFQCSDTTERGIWGAEEAITRKILLTTRRAIGPDTTIGMFEKNGRVTVLNSILQNWTGATSASSSSYLVLGTAGKDKPYKPFQGLLAELIVFDRFISFLERIQYETYLAIKYGASLPTGNYVSSSEKVLWHTEQNSKYGKNIAGIGRDDYFNLYQKQSGSAYDSGLLVISAGKLARDNDENKFEINNGDFILWGDNGLPLSMKQGVGADSVLTFVQRKWLVSTTGATASQLSTELQIDATKFPGDPQEYWLVIDRSSQGNFSVENLEYVVADRVENGKLIYKNVFWDTDHSGKDNFGFTKALDLFAIVHKLKNPLCADKKAGTVRIDIIAGSEPYQLSLANSAAGISRTWKQKEKSIDQKDLEAGNYTLTLTDTDNGTITRAFTLVMPDDLHISLGDDQKLSTDREIELDVSSQVPDSVAVSYRWQNNFGFSSSDKKIRVSESGIYKVSVTRDKDRCVFGDEIMISGSESQRIELFPNLLRSHEQYNINISLPEPAPVRIKVFDSRGVLMQEMQSKDSPEYQFTGAVKGSGVYLVVIQTPKGLETKKIIVH